MPAAWRDRLRQALRRRSSNSLRPASTSDRRSPSCRTTAPAIAISPRRSPRAGNVVLPFSFGFGAPTQRARRSRRPRWRRPLFASCMGRARAALGAPLDADQPARADPELGRRGGQPRPHQRRARPGRRGALRVPGHRLRGRVLSVVCAGGGAPASRGGARGRPARARPRRPAGRSPGADRRSHAACGQLPRARSLSRP